MEWWQAVILGLVEGVTEYLPVSSTGHLILAASLMGLDEPDVKPAVDAFNIVVQGGAILAVLGLYRARVKQMILGLLGRDAAGRRLLINLFVAFLPAAALGPLLADIIETELFYAVPVLSALFLGGVWMIWLDRWRARQQGHAWRDRLEGESVDERPRDLTIEELDVKRALLIGLLQVVAMWPGTSRSMMTIAGGAFVGLRNRDAAEFSFLLGLPTLGGACVYTLYGDYADAAATGEPTMFERLGLGVTLLGLGVATVSAALAVKWLVAFLTRHGLAAFGYYRIALSVALGALIWMGVVQLA